MSDARCIQCDHLVRGGELDGLKACPRCGCRSIPCDPAEDIALRINKHELRILTIWASNYSRHVEAEGQKTLACIFQRIRSQFPDIQLTLADEIAELQETYPNASLLDGDGNVMIPPKGKPD